MANLTMTTFVTLDGVMQAPGAPTEDPNGGFSHGGWQVPYLDDDMMEFMAGVFAEADAFLLGRRTYEIFAAYWPGVTDPAEPIAAALNGLPKYVASRTLERADWRGTTIVRDVVGEVPRLKAQLCRELQVHGSGDLAQTLLARGLVDELHLLIFPVALGSGQRLFGPGTAPTAFELLATRPTRAGAVIASYRRTGAPTYGTFGT